jgi:hypothetical protein
MTISTTASRISYTGNGSTDEFSFPYPVLATTDLVVIETIIATGVETVQVITTDYTVALVGGGATATVTAVTAPASTVTWTIYRDPAQTQGTDFTDNDPLPAASIEDALDRLTMIEQRSRSLVDRSLKQPEGDTADIDYLPAKVDRASKYMAFDADGDPIATAGTTSVVTVSTFMETLLDDTTAVAGRTTLGALADSDTSTTFVGNNEASAANIRAGTANQIVTPETMEAASEEVTLTDAATIAVDWSTFLTGVVTLTDNRTLGAPTNAEPGTWRTIRVVQDGTGSRTLGYNAVYLTADNETITLSTGAADKDTLYIYCETTSLFHVSAAYNWS